MRVRLHSSPGHSCCMLLRCSILVIPPHSWIALHRRHLYSIAPFGRDLAASRLEVPCDRDTLCSVGHSPRFRNNWRMRYFLRKLDEFHSLCLGDRLCSFLTNMRNQSLTAHITQRIEQLRIVSRAATSPLCWLEQICSAAL